MGHALRPILKRHPACLSSENTYPGVIKPESKKGKLEVKILVNLWYGIVDVRLVVTIAVVAALVKETVQEFAADLPQASLSDDVGIFTRSNSMGWWSISVVSAICNRRGTVTPFNDEPSSAHVSPTSSGQQNS